MGDPAPRLGAAGQDDALLSKEPLHVALDLPEVCFGQSPPSFCQLGVGEIVRGLDHLQAGASIATKRPAFSVVGKSLVEPLAGQRLGLALAQLHATPGDLEETVLDLLGMAAPLASSRSLVRRLSISSRLPMIERSSSGTGSRK